MELSAGTEMLLSSYVYLLDVGPGVIRAQGKHSIEYRTSGVTVCGRVSDVRSELPRVVGALPVVKWSKPAMGIFEPAVVHDTED